MKKTSYIILALALSFGILGLAKSTWAAGNTFYVCDTGSSCGSGWSTGNDSNAGTSKGSPCKTIKGGIAKMAGGDNMIIGDGIYAGTNNMLANTGNSFDISGKSGNQASPTIIRAENDFGVIIDGQGTNWTGWTTGGSWIIFRGLHFKNSSGYGFRIDSASNMRVIRCATEEQVSFGFAFTGGTTNSLMEECAAWGRGTYFFDDNNYWGHNDNNIYRKCFVRRDAHYCTSGGNQYASFATYWAPTTATYFQNDISADSQFRRAGDACDPANSSILYTANGTVGFTAEGIIGINEESEAFEGESGSSGSVRNSAFYTTASGWADGMMTYGPMTIENNLIADNYGGQYQNGIWQVQGTVSSVKNNIIYKHVYGLTNVTGNHSYNCLYNTNNYNYTPAGTGDRTYNPAANGLLYPVRVESGSNLAQQGESGGRIGPQILYQIGRAATDYKQVGGISSSDIGKLSGLLYNQTGWNELQDGQSGRALVKLWPFPNEDKIKTMMSAYGLHGATGARGFCTGTSKDGSPQTLTKYIWEYLGNQIPADVYGGSTPTVVYGDVSGDSSVSAYDASLAAQYAVSLITLTPTQITAADVSGDGTVSAYDASLIAQKAVGLITKFPVEGG